MRERGRAVSTSVDELVGGVAYSGGQWARRGKEEMRQIIVATAGIKTILLLGMLSTDEIYHYSLSCFGRDESSD